MKLKKKVEKITIDHQIAQDRRVESYIRELNAIYDNAIEEGIRIGQSAISYDDTIPFTFAQFSSTKIKINRLLNSLYSKVYSLISGGVRVAWDAANLKNDELVNEISKYTDLTKEQLAKYANRNLEALKAFQERKVAGMDLSKRVWDETKQFQSNLEMALDIGLGEGTSAIELAKQIQKYLREPDKLFRRVKDKWGNLEMGRNAAAYHPGQGVYRSAYQNAFRLTRTEINMAYRRADCEKASQLDFVRGIEVRRSKVPYPCKVCDALQGKYPPTFVFTSWHPSCRCYIIFIMNTEKEFINGSKSSVNDVTDLPDNFKEWVQDNEPRFKTNKIPLFLQNNKHFSEVREAIKQGAK